MAYCPSRRGVIRHLLFIQLSMARITDRRPPESKSKQKPWLAFVAGTLAVVGVGYFALRGGDPPSASSQLPPSSPFDKVNICRVYIENSGSMDGYMTPVNSQLKSDLNALISSISLVQDPATKQPLVDSISLNYINSKVIPIQQDISTFAARLSAKSFAEGGGQRGTTSLQALLDSVQFNTGKGEVSVLVSDMILALGNGQSPEFVSSTIETSLRKKLKEMPEWSVVVWRMLSDFSGKYYQTDGAGTVKIEAKRPYYVIFFGERSALRSLLAEGQIPTNQPLYHNRSHTMTLEPTYSGVEYKLAREAVLGKITLDREDSKVRTISEAEIGTTKDGKRGFAFEINMDYPNSLQAHSAWLSASNYAVTPDSYRVVSAKDLGGRVRLRLSADAVHRGEIKVAYRQSIPQWVYAVHSEQNSDIMAEGAMSQTYGIRYILEGLQRPYETTASQLIDLAVKIN